MHGEGAAPAIHRLPREVIVLVASTFLFAAPSICTMDLVAGTTYTFGIHYFQGTTGAGDSFGTMTVLVLPED